jgi:Zn-dependent protease/CBS domain-containing protein
MDWSIKLGRIFGINIKVHLTFFLILIWGAFSYGGSAGPLYGLIVTLALFTLVLLHELGHSLAAMGYGIPVKDITLLPIGGVARLARMPEKPIQELLVALAGPAVNVALALILLPLVLGLAAMATVPLSLSTLMRPGLLGLAGFLLSANISLALFNLIPAFPMDGGRVFRAILALFQSYERATQIAVTVGRVVAVGLALLGILSGQFLLAIIALFIFGASGQEGQAVAARSLLRRVRVGQTLPQNTTTVPPYATIGQVASMAMNGSRSNFAVLDPYSHKLLGVASSGDMIQAMERGQWHESIAEIMQPVHRVPSVYLNTTLAEVQDKLAEASSRIAAVYDGPLFRGLISLEDVQRAFQFLSHTGSAAGGSAWMPSR